MLTTRKGKRGFGLIEILITLGVLSVGILGVTVLHSVITRQSIENKARGEALALAQSRIEEMRNYTSGASTQAEFDALYADTAGFGNSTAITGTNAVFTRTESIASSGNLKSVTINVAWADPENVAQNVSLATELSYVSPRSSGDTALEATAPEVDSPTGRARLGEGELPVGATTTPNGDGTSLYDADGDRMLVSGDDIVLTLVDACQTEQGTCIDFVRIKGRIYIDTGSQNNLPPKDVHVVASDAAFCARYYQDGNGDNVPFTAATTATNTTASGDYEYFDYTCYLGGGWHGNIGIILSGGLAQSDKICLGDPTSIYPFEQPVIASRRAYRGMLFKKEGAGREQIDDGNGGTMDRLYSQGIADGIELPDPNTADKGHDFVIASMAAADNAGSDCIDNGVVVRTDSNVNGTPGDLFAGMPTDFICLNDVDGLLDLYDTAVYGNDSGCPYDPSDPPSTRHFVKGTINVLAPQTADNDTLMESINALTSDGENNCAVAATFVHDGTYYSGDYECSVYDWGSGWNGFIEVTYDASSMSCTPNRITLANITMDDYDNDYNDCSPGTFAVFSGTVTAAGNRTLANAVLSDGGVCTIAVGGLSYQCITQEFVGATWTGTMTFTPSGGALCSAPSNNGVFTFTNQASGLYTQNLTIATNANGCP